MLAPLLHVTNLKLKHSVNNFNNTLYAFDYFIAKSSLAMAYICCINSCRVAQVSFSFLRLFSQNVTVKSVLSFDFTCSGKGKPFLEPELVFIFGILIVFKLLNDMATHYTCALRIFLTLHYLQPVFQLLLQPE